MTSWCSNNRAALLAAVGVVRAATATTHPPIWSEEFDGTALDTSIWRYDVGGGGWGNDEFQVYAEENVAVADGILTITAAETVTTRGPNTSKSYTSGRIRSNEGGFAFTYGTVEVRMKLPDLQGGLWPAFWMLGSNFDDGVSWPECGEIDIIEMGYVDWTRSEGTCLNRCDPDCYASGQFDPNCVCCREGGQGGDGTINRSANSAFHFEKSDEYGGFYCDPKFEASADFAGAADKWITLTMEWTPNAVNTYIEIDGTSEQMCSLDISSPETKDLEEFHRPFFFIANLAVGGRYTGQIYQANRIQAQFPAELKIDYIRVYDNGSTQLLYPPTPTEETSPPSKAPSKSPVASTSAPTKVPTGSCLGRNAPCSSPTECCSESGCLQKGPNKKCA